MNTAITNGDTAITNRRQLAQRLHEVTRGFQFRWGEPANCGDHQVCVALDDEWDENDQLEYLVSVFAADAPLECLRGLPWTVRQSQTGELVEEGQTDRYGCFRLGGLPDGDYALELGIDARVLLRPAAAIAISAGRIHSMIAQPVLCGAERVFERFHSPDGAIVGTVRETPRGLVLSVQISREVIRSITSAEHAEPATNVGSGLATFSIFGEPPSVGAEQRQPLIKGYVGLYPDGGDTAVGSIFLERLPDRIQTLSDNYSITITPVCASELTAADRQDIERCRDASEGHSRAALDDVLRSITRTE
jgi:hypothetical protein